MAIQIRRGTNTEWESNNSNIVVGEPAIATDAERFFVGTASGDYAEFANLDVIAPAYDTSTSYVVGDVINRQGKLYSCNTPCSGSFNPSYWDEKSLAEILKDLENEIDYAQYEIGYANGKLITIDNGASEIPVKDLTVDIEAVQSGSGDPSPENIRPISGWDEVNVNRIGKNWCNKNGDLVLGFWILSSGVPSITANASNIAFNYKIPIPKGESLTLSANTSINNFGYCTFQADGTYINMVNNNNTSSVTIASTTFDRYALVWVNRNNTAFSSLDSAREWLLSAEMQFEYSTQRTGFVSDGQTYTIDLDGTRYGGTLDVTSGVLTIYKKMYSIETNITYTHPSDWKVGAWYCKPTNNSDMKSISGFGTLADAISNIAPVDTPANIASTSKQNTAIGIGSGRNVYVYLGAEYDTQEKIKQVLSDSNAYYVAELATPQVVQLTSTQVRTLLGTNNLWNQMNSNNELAYRISNALN